MDILRIVFVIIVQTIILYSYTSIVSEKYTKEIIRIPSKLSILGVCIVTSILIELMKGNLSFFVYLICIIPIILIYKIILKYSKNSTIIYTLLLFLITSISEMLAFLLIKSIYNTTFENILLVDKLYFTYYLIKLVFSVLFIVLLTWFINKNRKKVKYIIDILNEKELIIIIILVLSVILPGMLRFWLNRTEYNLNLLSLSIIQVTIITTLICLYFKYINYYKKSQTELYQTQIYNKALSEMLDSLRALKHDYNNILQSINGYIITKEYDKLDTHITKLIEEAREIVVTESINPEIINQPAIYGIVGSKYFYAINKNIKFKLDIYTSIKDICFDFTDLSRVLGILLDNAIEASQKAETPYITLKFSYNKYKSAHIIEVKNSIAPNIKIDLDKIFMKGVSTKKVKSGIGLWKVKKIISSKPNSQIYAEIENNEFSQTIIIEKI